MRSNRFVLDNNIWISYFITGKISFLKEIIQTHKIDIFICDELLKEFKEVSRYPRLLKYNINTKEALETIKVIGMHVDIPEELKQKEYIKNDPKDNYLIALALYTSSGFIISNDDHLIKDEKANLERKYKKLKILTQKEFETMFR